MINKLLPCPFCGSPAKQSCDLRHIQCSNWKCLQPNISTPPGEDATSMWNTRTGNEALREAMEIGLECAQYYTSKVRGDASASGAVRKIEAAIASLPIPPNWAELDQSGEADEVVDTVWDAQDLTKTNPATAFHLIQRHADNWKGAGEMMESWARAWYPANAVAPMQALVDQAQALNMGYGEPLQDTRQSSGNSGELNTQPTSEQYSDMLRELCCFLSVGGYNSEGLMSPDVANDKIRTGIDILLAGHFPAVPEGWQLVPKKVDEVAIEFEQWFLSNYGPDCILHNPLWHVPKIYRAACRAMLATAPTPSKEQS